MKDLYTREINEPVAGVNNTFFQIPNLVDATIISTDNMKNTFLVVNQITDDLGQLPIDSPEIKILENINLADEDILLGRHNILRNLTITNNDLSKELKTFWTIGNCSYDNNTVSLEDSNCEEHFIKQSLFLLSTLSIIVLFA